MLWTAHAALFIDGLVCAEAGRFWCAAVCIGLLAVGLRYARPDPSVE